MALTEVRYASAGALKRRGRADVASSIFRDALIRGVDDPATTGNSGLRTAKNLLTQEEVVDKTYSSQPTGPVRDTVFSAFPSMTGLDLTYINCWFRGPASNPNPERGLAHATNAAVRRLRFIDCLFEPQVAFSGSSGFLGHDATFTRCEFRGTTDGIGLYDSANKTGDIATLVDRCWIHDLVMVTPDQYQSNNVTHNDGIQIQGGRNIQVLGTRIDAFYWPTSTVPGGTANKALIDGRTDSTYKADGGLILCGGTGNPYFPSQHATSAVMVTPRVGAITDVTVDRCWIDGGAVGLNYTGFGTATAGQVVVTNNKIGTNYRTSSKHFVLKATSLPITYSGNTLAATGAAADTTYIKAG